MKKGHVHIEIDNINLWKEFKLKAKRNGITLSAAFSEAIKNYVDKQ